MRYCCLGHRNGKLYGLPNIFWGPPAVFLVCSAGAAVTNQVAAAFAARLAALFSFCLARRVSFSSAMRGEGRGAPSPTTDTDSEARGAGGVQAKYRGGSAAKLNSLREGRLETCFARDSFDSLILVRLFGVLEDHSSSTQCWRYLVHETSKSVLSLANSA